MDDTRKLKMFSINSFMLLCNVAHLNVPALLSDIAEVREAMWNSNETPCTLPHYLVGAISMLVIAKFIVNFINIVAHVVAVYPILEGGHIQMLMPAIIFQAIDNILLNSIELVLGFITLKHWPSKLSLYLIMFVKGIIKITVGLNILNHYADYFQICLMRPLSMSTLERVSVWSGLPLQLRPLIRACTP